VTSFTPSNSLNLNLGNNVKLSLNYETSDKEIDHSETAKNSLGCNRGTFLKLTIDTQDTPRGDI
jgi:hypothetical protein